MQKMERSSNWIWIDSTDTAGCEKEPYIVFFRKSFWHTGHVKISANCRYKLYINGSFVQEGPQKGSREMAYEDEASFEGLLRPGRNTAAVEVLYYPSDIGKRNHSLYDSPFPCLYIEEAGTGHELDGKSGWKYYRADHIRIIGEPFEPAPIHGMEIVNGCNETAGWMGPDYDDRKWKDARPYTVFEANQPVAPFFLGPRTIPCMEHDKKTFDEVVCVRYSSDGSGDTVKTQWNQMLKKRGLVEVEPNAIQVVEISAGEEICGYPSLSLAYTASDHHKRAALTDHGV